MEQVFLDLIDRFLNKVLTVQQFVDMYILQRRVALNNGTFDELDDRLQRLLSRIFTLCDCYSAEIHDKFELTEDELRNEVALLRYIWWG